MKKLPGNFEIPSIFKASAHALIEVFFKRWTKFHYRTVSPFHFFNFVTLYQLETSALKIYIDF